MEEAKITSKGQITIPKKPIEDLKGILHRPGQEPKTIEEMNEGEYLKEKYRK